MTTGVYHDTATETRVTRVNSAPHAAAPTGDLGRAGRPPGPSKLRLTKEVSEQIVSRVRIRMQAMAEHSRKAIAADLGVTESAITGAIARLRDKGLL